MYLRPTEMNKKKLPGFVKIMIYKNMNYCRDKVHSYGEKIHSGDFREK